VNIFRPTPVRTSHARLAPLALLVPLLVTGCAAGSDSTASPSDTASVSATSDAATSTPTETASTPAAPADSASASPSSDDGVRIVVTVKDGKVSPATHRVKIKKGERVRLEVTSDVADEVHVHGFDKSKDVKPGKPADIRFVADQSGLFEVELENKGLELVQLEVR
jgi:cytoskeletal protein RodZ